MGFEHEHLQRTEDKYTALHGLIHFAVWFGKLKGKKCGGTCRGARMQVSQQFAGVTSFLPPFGFRDQTFRSSGLGAYTFTY